MGILALVICKLTSLYYSAALLLNKNNTIISHKNFKKSNRLINCYELATMKKECQKISNYKGLQINININVET